MIKYKKQMYIINNFIIQYYFYYMINNSIKYINNYYI